MRRSIAWHYQMYQWKTPIREAATVHLLPKHMLMHHTTFTFSSVSLQQAGTLRLNRNLRELGWKRTTTL